MASRTSSRQCTIRFWPIQRFTLLSQPDLPDSGFRMEKQAPPIAGWTFRQGLEPRGRGTTRAQYANATAQRLFLRVTTVGCITGLRRPMVASPQFRTRHGRDRVEEYSKKMLPVLCMRQRRPSRRRSTFPDRSAAYDNGSERGCGPRGQGRTSGTLRRGAFMRIRLIGIRRQFQSFRGLSPPTSGFGAFANVPRCQLDSAAHRARLSRPESTARCSRSCCRHGP